jgi:hypothetical protein
MFMKLITLAALIATAHADVEVTRHVTSVEAGASGSANLDKDCVSTDTYGCESAKAAWGDNITVTYNAVLPHDLTEDFHVKVNAKVNNIIPFKVDCAVCGANCTVTIPIVKTKITVVLPPCPIKADTYKGTAALVLPIKAPVPLKVSFTGSGTLEDSKGTVVIAASASGEVTPK